MTPDYIKISTLCDNIVEKSHLIAEHGLSFFIETAKINVLFDTGQGLAIKRNAKVLNVDLKSVDAVVISHGHYDHTGGLKKVLREQDTIKIYAHPDIFQLKYRKLKTGKMRYIGSSRSLIKNPQLNWTFNLKPYWLSKKIFLTGQIPRKTSFEKVEEEFYIKSGNSWINDKLLDDQALVINTTSGLVLILGCSHSGLINTLRYVKEVTGKKDFYFVIGGTHLRSANQEKIEKTIAALGEFNIQKLILTHCTGISAFNKVYHALGEKVSLGQVGERWHILKEEITRTLAH